MYMLVAIMKILVFLCILIIPLRGPSRRRESPLNQSKTETEYSNYAINEKGGLEVLDKENDI